MEKAVWNGELLVATEIAVKYETEKMIRKASRNKELKCADSGCSNPVVRYCHGDKRCAFFAHLENCNCDYYEFDRNDTSLMQTIRRNIREHFEELGYNVKTEVKLLAHHYSHIVFGIDHRRIVIELGTRRTSVREVESLNQEYEEQGTQSSWVVVDYASKYVVEGQTFFLNRYVMNESKNKSLIVIDKDAVSLSQYAVDNSEYTIGGISVPLWEYGTTYHEKASIHELTLVNGELSIRGFEKRFEEWLVKKRRAFSKAKEERKHILKTIENHPAKTEQVKMEDKEGTEFQQLKNEIMPHIDQQKTQVRDSKGNRWIKCEVCGKVDTDDNFVSYGGRDHINLGKCYPCSGRIK